jgi:hypothetical protein
VQRSDEADALATGDRQAEPEGTTYREVGGGGARVEGEKRWMGRMLPLWHDTLV